MFHVEQFGASLMIDEDGLKKKLEDLLDRGRKLEHYCKELKYSQAGLEIRIDGMSKKAVDYESYVLSINDRFRNLEVGLNKIYEILNQQNPVADPRRFVISDPIKSNKCNECAGRGEVYFRDEDNSSNFLKVKICEVCQGTGIIK
jgi:hypothetical protein